MDGLHKQPWKPKIVSEIVLFNTISYDFLQFPIFSNYFYTFLTISHDSPIISYYFLHNFPLVPVTFHKTSDYFSLFLIISNYSPLFPTILIILGFHSCVCNKLGDIDFVKNLTSRWLWSASSGGCPITSGSGNTATLATSQTSTRPHPSPLSLL